MREDRREHADEAFNMQSLLQGIRAIGAVLGMIAMVVGLVYATRMFGLIFTALQAPDGVGTHFKNWTVAVGGEGLDIVVAGATYHCANFLAVVVVGCGALVLTWLSMGLILAGAKTMSWMLSDREAVKRLLIHAFGPAQKSEPNTSGGKRHTVAGVSNPSI